MAGHIRYRIAVMYAGKIARALSLISTIHLSTHTPISGPQPDPLSESTRVSPYQHEATDAPLSQHQVAEGHYVYSDEHSNADASPVSLRLRFSLFGYSQVNTIVWAEVTWLGI